PGRHHSDARCEMLLAMPPSQDVIDAIDPLLEALLETLERGRWVTRPSSPPMAPHLAEQLAPGADAVAAPLSALEKLDWPDDLRFMRDRLLAGAREEHQTRQACCAAP